MITMMEEVAILLMNFPRTPLLSILNFKNCHVLQGTVNDIHTYIVVTIDILYYLDCVVVKHTFTYKVIF